MDGFLILAIETATGCGSVCLSRVGTGYYHLLAECSSQPDITHSRRLLGSINWLMEGTGLSWDNLDAVAVSTGPGSFTGLRIGMAAAKSISMAANIHLVGVPTLDALACATGMKNQLVCSILDARKKQVYAGFYRMDMHGRPVRLGEPQVVDHQDLLEQFSEPVLLVGPGAFVYRDCFKNAENVSILPEHLSLPRALNVCLLAGDKIVRGEIENPMTAIPLYVRACEAEVNLQR